MNSVNRYCYDGQFGEQQFLEYAYQKYREFNNL